MCSEKGKLISLLFFKKWMKQEMIQISKKEYEDLLEEICILRNPEMMEAIRESDEATHTGVETWNLKTHS